MSEYIISLADIKSVDGSAPIRAEIKGWLDNPNYLDLTSPQDTMTGIVGKNIALLASKTGEICGTCNSVVPGILSLHTGAKCEKARAFDGFQAPDEHDSKLVECCICHAKVNKNAKEIHMFTHTFIQKFLAGCAFKYNSAAFANADRDVLARDYNENRGDWQSFLEKCTSLYQVKKPN